jgi:hypothetical protein
MPPPPPLPLPSVGTYAQLAAGGLDRAPIPPVHSLSPVPEALGTVQSVAGARAEGHPVTSRARVMERLHAIVFAKRPS